MDISTDGMCDSGRAMKEEGDQSIAHVLTPRIGIIRAAQT
jgi:hypothetical protein